MACGPVTGSESASGGGAMPDPFSFSQQMLMAPALGAVATFWTAPLRAAFVVAEEALRETNGPLD